MSPTYNLMLQAMRQRLQVVCVYQGHKRILCPAILGHKDGAEKVLALQVGGSSGSGPVSPAGDWKCLRLAEVHDAALREGRWIGGKEHRAAQRCIDVVDYDVNPESPYHPRLKL